MFKNSKMDLAGLTPEHAALQRWHFTPSERLAALSSFYDGGVLQALSDALILCRELSTGETTVQVPLWVADGAIAELNKLLVEGLEKTAIGRHAKSTTATRDWQRHFRRYHQVRLLMAKGTTLEDAFLAVSISFDVSHDPAHGAPDTIRKSYKMAQKALKDPKSALALYPRLWPK